MSGSKVPLRDCDRKAIQVIVVTLFFAAVGFGLVFAGLVMTSNNRFLERAPAEPLQVDVVVGEGVHRVDGFDRAAAFCLPLDEKTPFMLTLVAEAELMEHEALTNVTFGCDYVSANVTFLDSQSQPVVVPFEVDVGTFEAGETFEFAGFLETALEHPGMFKMEWHVTSDQTAYEFVVYL